MSYPSLRLVRVADAYLCYQSRAALERLRARSGAVLYCLSLSLSLSLSLFSLDQSSHGIFLSCIRSSSCPRSLPRFFGCHQSSSSLHYTLCLSHSHLARVLPLFCTDQLSQCARALWPHVVSHKLMRAQLAPPSVSASSSLYSLSGCAAILTVSCLYSLFLLSLVSACACVSTATTCFEGAEEREIAAGKEQPAHHSRTVLPLLPQLRRIGEDTPCIR